MNDDEKNRNKELDPDAADASELSIDDMDSKQFGDYIDSVRYGGNGSYTVDSFPGGEGAGEDEDGAASAPGAEEDPDAAEADGKAAEANGKAAEDMTPAEPFKSYMSEDDWKSDVNAEIDKYKTQRDNEEKEKYGYHDTLAALLPFFYADSDDKIGALISDLKSQASAREDEKDRQEADAAGKSLEDYREDKRRDEDAAKWREHEKRMRDVSSNRDSIVREWLTDSDKLKLLHDDFDLKKALENALFKDALRGGKNIFQAFMAMSADSQEPPEPEEPKEPEPPKPKREPIMQNASSSAVGRGSSQMDPAKLSSADFKKYIESRKNS